jgi:hypothetical protein
MRIGWRASILLALPLKDLPAGCCQLSSLISLSHIFLSEPDWTEKCGREK